MAYVSLYRKYRSQTFGDVMGQEHVTKTLQNALRLGKIGHAYLFCGTRGTGKTTTARLLAKALNCQNGPTCEPCNACPSCQSINEGSAMDIVELDAASHRGIRDVEEIRENVKFPPMELRYKVFIIDEAHQLSSDAKDAFLKTLEEPPAHVVFILATTEPQSIPITIRSRCQQFDFRRGSLGDIERRLKFVVDSEGVKAEKRAMELIAINADGSWRDSLSLLEQVLAYTDGELTTDDVNSVLGTVTQDFLFNLADILADGDEKGAFETAAKAMESGKDVQQLLKSIAMHFRNLLFAMVTRNVGDLASSAEAAERLKTQAARFSKSNLLRFVEIFSEAAHEARYSDHHYLLLELALLKSIEASHTRVEESPARYVAEAAGPVAKAEVESPKLKTRPTAKPATAPTPPPANGSVPSRQKLPEFDTIRTKWNMVLQHVKSISPIAYGLLKDAVVSEVREDSLVLCFQGVGQKNLLDNESATGKTSKKQALRSALERVFGVPNAGIICEVASASTAKVEQKASAPVDQPSEPQTEMGQETFDSVLEIFPNAMIVDN